MDQFEPGTTVRYVNSNGTAVLSRVGQTAVVVEPKPTRSDDTRICFDLDKSTSLVSTANLMRSDSDPTEADKLRAEIAIERDRAQQAEQRLAEFQERVVDVASRYANEHDWCSVVDNALEELGLERKPQWVKVVVTTEHVFYAKRTDGATATDDYAEQSINGAHNVTLDSDWETDDDDHSVESVYIEVDDR